MSLQSVPDTNDELIKAADQLQYVQTLELSENAEFNKTVRSALAVYLFCS